MNTHEEEHNESYVVVWMAVGWTLIICSGLAILLQVVGR